MEKRILNTISIKTVKKSILTKHFHFNSIKDVKTVYRCVVTVFSVASF